MKNFVTAVISVIVFLVIILELLLLSCNNWFFSNLFLLISIVSILYSRNHEKAAFFVLIMGSTILDLIIFRTIGLQSFIYIAACLVVYFISKFVGVFDNQSKRIKLLIITVLFYILYTSLLYSRNILDLTQLAIIVLINTIIIIISLVLFGKQRNAKTIYKF